MGDRVDLAHGPEQDDDNRWWLGVWLAGAGLAVAQPVVALLANNPLLVAGAGRRRETWIVLGLVLVVLPLAFVGLDLALRGRRPLVAGFRAIGATTVFGLAIARWAAELGVEARSVTLVVGAVLAAGAAAALFRFQKARQFVSFLVLVVPVGLIGLVQSDAGEILTSEPATTAPLVTPSPVGAEQPPIVMLVVDELPTRSIIDLDGEVDAERFPNLAAFGEQATWYRRFTAVAPFTQQVVPSMLTGNEPSGEEAVWVNYPESLFSLLAADYHLVGGESVTKLCGLPVCEPWPPIPPASTADAGVDVGSAAAIDSGRSSSPSLRSELADLWWEGLRARDSSRAALDDFVEEVAPGAPRSSVAVMPDDINSEGIGFGRYLLAQPSAQPVRLTEFIGSFRTTETPTLYFLHMVLPHHPYLFDASGTPYETATGEAEPFSPNNDTPQIARIGERRHLQQAAYVDSLLGQIFDELRANEIFDDAYIVLAADHGLDFVPGEDHREFSAAALPGIAYAPLFIKEPNQQSGVIDDSNVLSYDLLPTIAAAAGIEVPWSTTGRTIGGAEQAVRGDSKPFFVFEDAFSPELVRVEQFSDAAEFSRVLNAPAIQRSAESDVDPAVAALVGEPFAPEGETAGQASVSRLATFSDPAAVPTGVLSGWIDADITDVEGDAVVIAIADVVVAVAPLEAFREWSRYFAADLLPIARQPVGAVRIGLVGNDGSIDEIVVVAG